MKCGQCGYQKYHSVNSTDVSFCEISEREVSENKEVCKDFFLKDELLDIKDYTR